MIDGDPRAGKTTFIKRLCYIWAEGVLQAENPHTRETDYLHSYLLVIPIILRFISEENNIMEVFKSQLNCLNIHEICALVNLLESKPNQILLLLDGYDEYKGQSVISKVITKGECAAVLTITTSRPHAIEQLRRHTSQAVDQLIRLCGFSEDQVKLYIKQFFEQYNLPTNTGEDLIKTLFEKRPDILEVAKIPIRTEMICEVWAIYGKLGQTMTDLYKMFITHLFTHWQAKKVPTQKISENQVLDTNKYLSIKIGRLADTWEKCNRLRIVFSTEELEEILGEDFDKVINIGILTKSHPSHILQESKWSFPHLTIQEYFVAYFLGQTEDTQFVDEFASSCKEYRVLQRCEVIFMFLCSEYPGVANKILTLLVRQEKDEKKCRNLLNFISKLIKHYDSSKINIPLPYCVDIKSIEEHCRRYGSKDDCEFLSLYKLLESEKRQEKPNLHSLTVCNILQYRDFMDLTYLQRLDVEVGSKEELSMLKQKIQHMEALESLRIGLYPEEPDSECIGSYPDSDYSSEESLSDQSDASFTDVDLVSSIPTDKMTSLSITGPDVIKATADHIQKFTILQQLHIDETSNKCTEETRNKLISSLNDKNNIKEVSLCVPDLDDNIIQKLNMKVKIQVKMGTLSEDSLRKAVRGLDFTEGMKAVRGLDFTGGLYKLDLSENNLRYEGESLGELMARMTTLRVLDVWRCNIQAYTVQAMVETIKEIKVTSGLHVHTLYMGRYRYDNNNSLHTGGCYLGELIALIPDLHTLDLSFCNLTNKDLVNMSDLVPATTRIDNLNLKDNHLTYKSKGLAILLSQTQHLRALAVNGDHVDSYRIPLPDPIIALCKAADAGSLTNLHLLDMSDSELQPGSLEKLGQHLQYMNSLHVINLAGIYRVKPEDYQHIYSNLPHSLQHLNVWSSDINLDVYLIQEHKDNLNHLHRLNVRLSDSDIELLQGVLEQNNPHIHVYEDEEEDTWWMYVTDRDE